MNHSGSASFPGAFWFMISTSLGAGIVSWKPTWAPLSYHFVRSLQGGLSPLWECLITRWVSFLCLPEWDVAFKQGLYDIQHSCEWFCSQWMNQGHWNSKQAFWREWYHLWKYMLIRSYLPYRGNVWVYRYICPNEAVPQENLRLGKSCKGRLKNHLHICYDDPNPNQGPCVSKNCILLKTNKTKLGIRSWYPQHLISLGS